MRMIPFLLIGVAAAATTVACGHDHDRYGRGGYESGIVFGISQSTDPATGATTTRAGYEYLELARKGGWRTAFSPAGDDGVCFYEELDRRIGRPHVGDGGRARFAGGALPGEGLVVAANEDEPQHAGPAFGPGDTLVFDVEHGFAIPNIGAVTMRAPRTVLAIAVPPPGELSVDPAADLAFEWSPGETEDRPSRVMVAVETEEADGRGREVRCFYDEDVLRGVIPSGFIGRLGGSGTKGVVQIATHRQVTIFARGGWTIYVVGAIFHREQPFVLK